MMNCILPWTRRACAVAVALLGAAVVACTPESVDGAAADPPVLDARIWSIHEDVHGHRWFGSNGAGVYRFDGETFTHFTAEDGVVGNDVRSIVDDGRGGVIVTTARGASRFDGERFTPLEIVEPVAPDDGWRLNPDDVWLVVAPGERGPCRFDGERLIQLTLPESPAEAAHRARHPNAGYDPAGVYTVYRDQHGSIWCGTASVGLCRYDGESIAWMYEERLTTTPEGGAFGIRSIKQDRAGDYWICNTRQRYAIARETEMRDGFRMLQYTAKPGVPDAARDGDPNFMYTPSVLETPDGTLWFACGDDGVWHFDGTTITRHAVGERAYVLGLKRTRDGALWAGTLRQGVYHFDGERFVRWP